MGGRAFGALARLKSVARDMTTDQRTVGQRTCPCGSTSFEDGVIEDIAQGRVRWISGPMQLGLLGKPKTRGRECRWVRAWCCTACRQLTLYAE